MVVRLRALLETLWRRLEGREFGAGLDWHRRRAVELSQQMDETRVEDLLVDTDSRNLAGIAGEILTRTGWIDPDNTGDA